MPPATNSLFRIGVSDLISCFCLRRRFWLSVATQVSHLFLSMDSNSSKGNADSDGFSEQDRKDKRRLENQIFWFKQGAFALVVLGLVFFASAFKTFDLSTIDQFAQFGDFIGGTAGAVWALAGLVFIYVAFLGQKLQLFYQRLELHATREEMKNQGDQLEGQKQQLEIQNDQSRKQIFDNTFFQLLTLHNEIVKGIDILVPSTTRTISSRDRAISGDKAKGTETQTEMVISGRDCFEYFFNGYKKSFDRRKKSITDDTINQIDRMLDYTENRERDQSRPEDVQDALDLALKDFRSEYQSDFNHYVRNLLVILKTVKESEVENKPFYANLIRAQLSTYELSMLFYYGLTRAGQNLKPFLEDFGLFLNFADLVPDQDLFDRYELRAFGIDVLGAEWSEDNS